MGPNELKQEILEKVREYYHIAHEGKTFVPYETKVPYSGRVYDEREMVNLVDSALDFWLTLGPYGRELEERIERYLSARDVILVNSGSSANLLAVAALLSEKLEGHLSKGDEVITPAVTFPTTLAPIIQNGLLPVFVDCEVDTCNIDPSKLEDAISNKTRAIFLPHTLGNPCDMDIVMDLVERYDLFLIEDSCDALGATFDGKLVGTFGDLGTLSFYPAHQMTMGEGGAVIVNRNHLSRIVRSLRDWGRDCWCEPGCNNTCGKRFRWQLGDLPLGYDHKYIYSHIGYNLKPTDMQAAIGLAQFDKIDHFVAIRRDNFTKLYAGLEQYQDHLILAKVHPKTNPSWFGFPITVKNGVSRNEIRNWLEEAKIETRMMFGGNIIRQPGFRNIEHRVSGVLEQSDVIMNDTFFIGVYPGLTDEMIEFVLERFHTFFKNELNG